MKGVAICDVDNEIAREEENIECVLCTSEFLPSGRKSKIASSRNDHSYQNEALSLEEEKGVEIFPDAKKIDYLTCSCRVLKA